MFVSNSKYVIWLAIWVYIVNLIIFRNSFPSVAKNASLGREKDLLPEKKGWNRFVHKLVQFVVEKKTPKPLNS